MSLPHQRRWKSSKINVKSYGLKRIKCLFSCAFSSCTIPFSLLKWKRKAHTCLRVPQKFQGLLKIKRRTAKLVFHRGHECGVATEIPFGMAATSSFGSLCWALNLRIAKSRPWPWQWSGWVCNGFILKLVYLKLWCQKMAILLATHIMLQDVAKF